MRQARLKVPADQPAGFYHCISRVVDRRFALDDPVKERFVSLLRECEAFCEVRVLTYCVMSNHFHLLLEVPKRPDQLPTLEEMFTKLKALSGHQNVGLLRQQVEGFRKHKDAEAEAELLASLHARLWDLSAFMKLVKQRFTQWYNGQAGRKGTLWEERFKSVLVDGRGEVLPATAAYIDLNPVRAGLVKDPKDYRWSGYGEAVAGRKRAKLGIQRAVLALRAGKETSLGKAMQLYRMYVYNEGHEQREALGPDGRTVRGALKHEEVMAVLQNKGKLSLGDYVRCRVRYFTDGAVLGSREFVDGVFRKHRKRFGPRRKDGARRMRGLASELYALRDLRVRVFG